MAELDRRIASLSGSTADADIAQLRKLQAERRELQEGLDDTFYQHSMDSQSKALDDESEMFRETREDYLETLRDTLDDTTAIIEAKITELLTNADVVLNGLNTTSAEYGITLSDSLMLPWTNASATALAFKTSLDENLPLLTNDNGVVTIFGTTTETILTNAFGAGSTACNAFKTTVQTDVEAIKSVVTNATSLLTSQLKFPWTTMTSEDSPITTFSTKAKNAIDTALTAAKNKASSIKSNLTSPWNNGIDAINTWSNRVKEVLNEAQIKAREAGEKISQSLNIQVPSYTGSGNSGSGSGSGSSGAGNGSGSGNNNASTFDSRVKALQQVLNIIFKSGLKDDGYWGSKTESALRTAQKTMRNVLNGNWIAVNGKYDSGTRSAMLSYINHLKNNARGMDTEVYNRAKNILPVAFHAKGTLGTKQDEWAITDESWIGEEITLAAGKNGQLQYLKKGSAVMPADISANLVEWGKLNPNMMNMSGAVQGVNLMSNYISKPELNLSFDALVKAQNITEETLPAVKKIVTEELNKFTKQLNYAIKRK